MPSSQKLLHSRPVFRLRPDGVVVETRFPGITVPPPGENLFDVVPAFLHSQYQESHRQVMLGKPILGRLHLTLRDQGTLMWTACFKRANRDGSEIEGNCLDVLGRRRLLAPHSPLARACGFLDSRFREAIALEEVVKRSGLSRATLHRKFVAELGVSVSDYVTLQRINCAVGLLSQSDLDLATIALESGFCDQSYFGKRFRELTCYSPGAFRKIEGYQIS